MAQHDLATLALLALLFLLGLDRDYHRHWLLRLATIAFIAAALIPHTLDQPGGVRLLVSAFALVAFLVGAFVTGSIRISFRSNRKGV